MKKLITPLLLIITLLSLTNIFAVTYTVSSIPYSPYPYTGGTTLTLSDDQNTSPIPLGFPFQFFNVTHTSVIINSNAVIGFNGTAPAFRMAPLSNQQEIYANLHDMFPGNPEHPGNVNYYTVGTAPNRVFVVNYFDIVRFATTCTTHNYTGQVVLYEGSNNIDIFLQQKDSCDTSVPNSCIGIADTGGTNIYAPGRSFSNWYAENEGWRFCYNGVCTTTGVDYSFIKGKIYYDANTNCSIDLGEMSLPENNIELFETTTSTYRYASSDVAGNYTAIVDNGNWRVRVVSSPYVLAAACPDIFVAIDSTVDSALVDLPATIRSCPYLSTTISNSIIRPCSTVVHTVNYFNGGTTSPINTIDITLDTTLTYDSASLPLLSVVGNVYTFDLGAIPFLTGGSFHIYSSAPCWLVLGQTVCVQSHIHPDTICPPPPTGWDGSELEATAYEDTIGTDSVVLKVKNIGTGDMSTPTILTVVEDIIMIVNNTGLSLNSGQEIIYRFPSNGKTYIVHAYQTLNNPTKTYTTASIEGATNSPGDIISYGFINNFPLDDEPIYIDMACDEVRTSFDPNMKSSQPEGIESAHLVEKNTNIKYRIDFQNTGNDTAFYVAIDDSISPLLQIGTLNVIGSSHPVTHRFIANSKVKFEFNNIRLQDSTSNEPASHGYVEFTIHQQPNLPDGSVIYNSAGIIFDVNIPVITNTTFLTIGRLLNTGFNSVDNEKFDVFAYPNPFETEIHITSTQINNNTSIKIFNLEGKCIYEGSATNQEFVIHRKNLVAGMYIYNIYKNNKVMGTGKLIAQ